MGWGMFVFVATWGIPIRLYDAWELRLLPPAVAARNSLSTQDGHGSAAEGRAPSSVQSACTGRSGGLCSSSIRSFACTWTTVT